MIRRIIRKAINECNDFKIFNFGRKLLGESKYASPDFMIIGAAKAGTTSLFQYLAHHPQVVSPREKELRLLSRSGMKGLKDYLTNFPLKSEIGNKLTFEGTPGYLYEINGHKKLYSLFPDKKFIIVLRDPVARAFSHWTWHQEQSNIKERDRIDKRSFKEAVHQEISRPDLVPKVHKYLDKGLYGRQIKSWIKLFGTESLLILDFFDLRNNPKETLNSVTEFLGIRNVYEEYEISQKMSFGITGKDNDQQQKLKIYNAGVYKEKIDPETERFLRNYYNQYDEELKSITGRTFSWMKK